MTNQEKATSFNINKSKFILNETSKTKSTTANDNIPSMIKRTTNSHTIESQQINMLPTIYSSRGQMMLKAALGDKNCRDNSSVRLISTNKVPKVQLQQVKLLSIKRRPSRNKVLFTEPPVTNKFEYEQTQLSSDQIAAPSCLIKEDSHRRLELESTSSKKENSNRKRMNENNNNELVSPKRSSTKRKRYLLCNTDTHQQDPHNDTEQISNNSSSDQSTYYDVDDNSLFSSPKVAKIAPYYHDDEDGIKSDFKRPRLNEEGVEENRYSPPSSTPKNKYGNNEALTTSHFRQHDDDDDETACKFKSRSGLFNFINSFDSTKISQWFFKLLLPTQ